MLFSMDGVNETQAHVWPTIQMKLIDQYFQVVLFIMPLYDVVLTLWSVNDKLMRPFRLKVLHLLNSTFTWNDKSSP